MSNWMPSKNIFFPRDTDHILALDIFNNWYDMEIAPLFENAVRSYCNHEYTTLVINVKTQKETAEDLLRELVFATENAGIIEYRGVTRPLKPCVARAKAFLERNK